MRQNRRGITLVEVLVAIIILVFASVAIIQTYLSSLNFSELNKDNSVAMAHLINMLEAIKCTPFSQLLVDFPDGVVDGPSNKNYTTIVGNYTLKNEHIIVSYVDTSSDPLEIMVNLSWQDKKGSLQARYLVTKRTR